MIGALIACLRVMAKVLAIAGPSSHSRAELLMAVARSWDRSVARLWGYRSRGMWLGKACAGYRRLWQFPDGSWCVVVEINPHERGVSCTVQSS